MARSIPGAWDLSEDVGHLAMCVQITDRSVPPQVWGFTEHDRPLDIDISDGNGTVTYQPEASFTRSMAETRSAGRVGSMDLVGIIDSAGITREDILAKRFDSGLMRIFLVDWTQPAAGIAWVDIGELEETTVRGDELTVTFKSITDRLNAIEIGDYYQADCIHILGSMPTDTPPPFGRIGCQVQLEPDVWSAGVQVEAREDRSGKPPANASPDAVNTVRPTVENGRVFEASVGGTTGGSEPSWNTTIGGTTTDNDVTWITRQALRETGELVGFSDQSNLVIAYGGDAEDNWYRRGLIRFSSGANVGVVRQIKTATYSSPSDGTLMVNTWRPFPLAMDASPSDSVVLIVGCDKKLLTCKDKFRNLRNYGGMAIFAPTLDEQFKIPKQTS